jgi:hypothetical protein
MNYRTTKSEMKLYIVSKFKFIWKRFYMRKGPPEIISNSYKCSSLDFNSFLITCFSVKNVEQNYVEDLYFMRCEAFLTGRNNHHKSETFCLYLQLRKLR